MAAGWPKVSIEERLGRLGGEGVLKLLDRGGGVLDPERKLADRHRAFQVSRARFMHLDLHRLVDIVVGLLDHSVARAELGLARPVGRQVLLVGGEFGIEFAAK